MFKKILIVDDERTSRSLLQKAFEQEDYEITSIDDGRKGITAYLNSLLESPFHLIILDIKMPVTDGLKILQRIREEEATRGVARDSERSVPVIMVTADSGLRAKAFELGCDEYIAKPFDRQYLLNKVKELLA